MTTETDWALAWLGERELPAGVDRLGRIVAPIEAGDDDKAVREVRIGRSSGPPPLLAWEVHSADRIAAEHAPQVYAACNKWNSGRRLTRTWVVQRLATLSIVVGFAVPVSAANADVVRRAGDAVVDAAGEFWRWADLNAYW